MKVGDRVRIERDETRYPSKGTWPQFSGKTGTIVSINRDRERPHLTEYGVAFGKTRINPTHGALQGFATTWFKVYEMRVLAPQRHANAPETLPLIDTAGKVLAHA
jgi:hypothetical protein